MIKYLRDNFSAKKTNKLLLILLIVDLVFVVIHIVTCFLYFIGKIENFGDYNFLVLTQDESFAEIFQYLKYLSVIIMIGYLIYVEKAYAYISWILLFIFFLLDDSLSLHESMGEVLVKEFNFKPMFGLRDVDFGELTFVAMVGMAILLSFVLAYFKGNLIFKKRTIDLFILLGFMIFFGIGFDMLHEILGENLKVGFVIGLIEDGGEMVVMTLIVWYVYQLIRSDKKIKSYLFEILYPKKIEI
tara:strand:- start:323 stop:1051 length:729 start_codon:yes stop_codon:yes gene_type:complete